MRETAQPYYIEGYHRPDAQDPDDAVYAAISDLMSSGRTSRLYRSLVRDKKIAAGASGFSGLPGDKYPHLFAFFAVSTPGHTPQELRDGIRMEVERLKEEDVTDEEMKMVKTRAKANLIRRLASNNGLAFQLGWAQARYGHWRELFRRVDRIDKVTKADIRRIAQKVFVPENRTVGILESTRPAAGSPGQGGK
jgi:predicted Zn-dependent peptidase